MAYQSLQCFDMPLEEFEKATGKSLTNDNKSGNIYNTIVSGALNPRSIIAQNHADLYYEEKSSYRRIEVFFICKLDKTIYKCVTDDINTTDVIITKRQIEHINQRHGKDYEKYGKYLKEIIENPDYIVEANKPHTALVLKKVFVKNK